MTDKLKVYSVVINWCDGDREQGTYGETVRARDHDHAVRIVRARMMWNQWEEWRRIDMLLSKSEVADMYATETASGVQYFGSLIECSEGASWRAAEMEAALRLAHRALVAAYGEPGPNRATLESELGRDAILAARKIIEEIDAL